MVTTINIPTLIVAQALSAKLLTEGKTFTVIRVSSGWQFEVVN